MSEEEEFVAPPPPKEDYRVKQIQELEQLQKILDENNVLRAKFNALQAQVTPLPETFSALSAQALSNDQKEKVFTPEEIEQMQEKLEKTLKLYKNETIAVGQLNSEIERMYAHLSKLKMDFRLEQDRRITEQNKASANTLENFRAKTKNVKENWNTEKQRLEKQIGFLNKVHDSSLADIKEFDEQARTNNKGIIHLSSSITIAKEDIRDFTDQMQKMEPKLKEYEELQKKHQQSEIFLVELSDQYESLKKSVETESLTAKVRKEIEQGNQTIADINRHIDNIQCETTEINEKTKENKLKIQELENKLKKVTEETNDLKNVTRKLTNQKKMLQKELVMYREIYEERGGENAMISRKLQDGISVDKDPWEIRKQVLVLKNDVKEMEKIKKKQEEIEKRSTNLQVTHVVPQRKRIPMIPLKQKC